MKKTLVSVLVCLMLISICSFVACVNPTNENKTRTITDIDGVKVEIPETVTKAVALWSAGNQLMISVGGADIMYQNYGGFVEHKTAWLDMVFPDLKDKTIFAFDETTGEGYDPSVEEMLTVNPEVIFINDKDRAAEYRRGGLTVINCDSDSYETMLWTLETMGEVFGGEAKIKAEKIKSFYEEKLEYLNSKLANVSDSSKPSIYFLDSQQQTGALRTSGSGTMQEAWALNGGATYPAAELVSGRNKNISAEQLIAMDPDYIFVGGVNQEEAYNNLLANEVFSNLSAIKNNKVIRCPQGTWQWDKPCSESVMQMLFVAKTINPELFSDLDMVEVTKTFFKDIYGYTLDDATAQKILSGDNGRA